MGTRVLWQRLRIDSPEGGEEGEEEGKGKGVETQTKTYVMGRS